MPVPGVRTKICDAKGCRQEIIFLSNRETGRFVPVNVASLSDEDRAVLEATHRSGDLDYESGRHISHYRTCKDPGRFARRKSKR